MNALFKSYFLPDLVLFIITRRKIMGCTLVLASIDWYYIRVGVTNEYVTRHTIIIPSECRNLIFIFSSLYFKGQVLRKSSFCSKNVNGWS